MANRLLSVCRSAKNFGYFHQNTTNKRLFSASLPRRFMAVYSDSGALLQRPQKVQFGMLKVFLVVVPFLYCGGTLSKTGAAFLEENDIFVPDDDDD